MRSVLLVLFLFLLGAAPLAAQTATNACGPFSVSRGVPTATGAVPLTFKGNCILPRDTVRKTDTVTTTVTVVHVDTVYLTKPDTTPTPPVVVPPPVQTAVCAATDLLCDDFEDGDWYTKDCDAANSSGGLASQDGWCGTIYHNPITPAGAIRAGGVKGSKYAATTGTMTGAQGGMNMADHSLSTPSSNVYIRFYTKMLPGYLFGAEKVLSFNAGPAGSGGIYHGNLHFGCGYSGGTTSSTLQWQPVDGSNCRNILAVTSGRWYYIEVHLVTSPTMTVEVWADDCGPNGDACPATPTKRLTATGLQYGAAGTSNSRPAPVGSVWFESWANPGSKGERLIDNVRASTRFIGF